MHARTHLHALCACRLAPAHIHGHGQACVLQRRCCPPRLAGRLAPPVMGVGDVADKVDLCDMCDMCDVCVTCVMCDVHCV
jgi:hypothetical protein